MFSTDLSTFLVVFAAFLLMCASYVAYKVRRMANRVAAAVTYLHTQNKNAVSLRRIAELESTLTELSDSYEVLLKSVKKLGARARTRAAREKAGNGLDLDTSPPADESSRAAYKAKLRENLRKEGRL